MKLLLIAAVIGATALSASATECAVHNTKLTAPFAGRWRDKNGDSLDIAPGKLAGSFISNGQTHYFNFAFVAEHVSDDDDMLSLLDCRDLTEQERERIEEVMVKMTEAGSVPGSDEERQDRQDIAEYRVRTSHPPYRMLAATHYEEEQWLILVSANRLLNVVFGEGNFTVDIYERVANRN